MRLSEAINCYVRQKRAQGLGFKTQELTLLSFQDYITDVPVGEVTSRQALDFLNRKPTGYFTWMQKHRFLRMFFEFSADRGFMSALSIPQRERRTDDRRSVPFVYTRTQIRTLIKATQGSQSSRFCMITDATLRTALITLYATGALPKEIFWLTHDELDLKRNLIFLRGNANVTPRTVPLNRDLHRLLGTYLHSQERRIQTPNVFLSSCGVPISKEAFTRAFARLRSRAGMVCIDGSRRMPRLRDFRQTFAVHRIALWIEEHADLNRMLPALSAYMGLGGVTSAQQFLFMTPQRFKGVLDKLSPSVARKHWRDDAGLMKFLASL